MQSPYFTVPELHKIKTMLSRRYSIFCGLLASLNFAPMKKYIKNIICVIVLPKINCFSKTKVPHVVKFGVDFKFDIVLSPS